MWKMLLNIFIDFLLSLVKDKGVKEKDKIEVVGVTKPAPVLVPLNPNIVIPVEKGTIKPLLIEKLLPSSQYENSTTIKDFICLHHTAGYSADSTIAYWMGNKSKVATNFVLDRDGTIYLTVPLDKWAYHLGVNRNGNQIPKSYKKLGHEYDRRSIGIELASVGQLVLKDGVFYDVYKRAVHPDKVVQIEKYKGYSHWEKYSQAQIESLELLLLYLFDKYPMIKEKAKLKTDYSDIGEISQSALEMKDAIVSHSSLVTCKYDTPPQPNLVKMLNQLHLKL